MYVCTTRPAAFFLSLTFWVLNIVFLFFHQKFLSPISQRISNISGEFCAQLDPMYDPALKSLYTTTIQICQTQRHLGFGWLLNSSNKALSLLLKLFFRALLIFRLWFFRTLKVKKHGPLSPLHSVMFVPSTFKGRQGKHFKLLLPDNVFLKSSGAAWLSFLIKGQSS